MPGPPLRIKHIGLPEVIAVDEVPTDVEDLVVVLHHQMRGDRGRHQPAPVGGPVTDAGTMSLSNDVLLLG